MISIQHIGKKFELADPKKLREQELKDPRLRGRFFHSLIDVSFECERGQVLGLLGPNGAGKTTALRILSTALTPDQGGIFVDGQELTAHPAKLRQKIGFLSGSTGLYGRLTGRENIEYFGRLHGLSNQVIQQRLEDIVERLDMKAFIERRCETYSTGMKQKTAIARAVIHEPDVVILDEPTTGLDIMATQTVLEFIRQLKANGTPVIFSTHHLDEVQALCDQVCVIQLGKNTFNGTFSAFAALSEKSLHHAFMQTLQEVG